MLNLAQEVDNNVDQKKAVRNPLPSSEQKTSKIKRKGKIKEPVRIEKEDERDKTRRQSVADAEVRNKKLNFKICKIDYNYDLVKIIQF